MRVVYQHRNKKKTYVNISNLLVSYNSKIFETKMYFMDFKGAKVGSYFVLCGTITFNRFKCSLENTTHVCHFN